MATMNVSLPLDLAEFVERLVAEGRYTSTSEVFRDALRLLEHDKAMEKEKLAVLRREIDIGLAAASAGRFSNKTVSDMADEVRSEHSGE